MKNWLRRYDRRALIGIAAVYAILILGALVAGLCYRDDIGRLVTDIEAVLSPTALPGNG